MLIYLLERLPLMRENEKARCAMQDVGLNFEHAGCVSAANDSMTGRVRELLYPGSPWAHQYPELLNITT